MRSFVLPLSIAALALNGCALTPAQTARAADERAATQAALGKDLAGLAPTETRDCLDRYQSSSLKAYGSTLVYRVSSKLSYVNETGGGCEGVEHPGPRVRLERRVVVHCRRLRLAGCLAP